MGTMPRPSQETRNKAKEKGLINALHAARIIGKNVRQDGKPISRRTLGRLARDKIVDSETIDGVVFFDPDSLEDLDIELEEDSMKDGREYVLDWTLGTLDQQKETIDSLVRLAYEGPQATIKALIEENKSLRDRCRKADETIAEVWVLYTELLKEMKLQTIDAERETAKIKMQQDAFAFLKDKLGPVMLENAGASKLLNTLTDVQIEAFIESGAADAQQVEILRKELKRRKAKQLKRDNVKDGEQAKEAQSVEPSKSRTADSP